MESKYRKIRLELDELGYYQKLSLDSIPLVNKLVADLTTTSENLQKYMKLAQSAIEERDTLQAGAEPYKCDNARLVKECNELHLSFLQYKEENDKIQAELKTRLEDLRSELSVSKCEKQKLRHYIQQLESDLLAQSEGLLSNKSRPKKSAVSRVSSKTNFEIDSAMALADQKVAALSKEIKKLKEQNLQLTESNEMLHNKCHNRDEEINRLVSMLEGGRPLGAIKKDCYCMLDDKESKEKLNFESEDLNRTKHEKSVAESRLKEALAKQHEAMNRALHLAERNKQLEQEMKDIDRLALAVEAECNHNVKNSNEKVIRLQERMHSTVLQIQTLERENAKLKQDKQELSADLDAIIVEKKHLQTVLETALDDKKRLNDRINNYTVIEHDLNMEIDRLNRISAEQKRKMAELGCCLIDERVDSQQVVQGRSSPIEIQLEDLSPTRKTKNAGKNSKSKKKSAPTKRPSKGSSPPLLNEGNKKRLSDGGAPTNTPCISKCCESCGSSKHLKELLDKELEYREQQANRCLENLKSEKDYYMKEYHKVLEQIKNIPQPDRDLADRLKEKEQVLSTLQKENKMLSQEKYHLMSRLESAREESGEIDGTCLKITCKRTERERDLLRSDLERLEEERDTLKQRIRTMQDGTRNEQERLTKCLKECEEQVRKLEQERRELSHNQGSSRTAISTLGDQCDYLKEQLRLAQSELNQQRSLYNQMRSLQEQTDRALSDAKNKLLQSEAELESAMSGLKKRDLDQGSANKEVDVVRSDLQIMKGRLAKMDNEKDELLAKLDDKTERVAQLEAELRSKQKTIDSLEGQVNDLKKKISLTAEATTSRDHLLRSSNEELNDLRRELESLKRIRDATVEENRMLQSDLAAATVDCRDARKELEICRRQVEDLKTQLQHYVAEVKRTEDLISNKEIERTELLDQFRSLSHEANLLENNNHHLETEATQSRVQLSVALDHAQDLEHKLENKESVIRSYEKQITDLTSQIASLEMQLRECTAQYEHTDMELQKMRDLCFKLDTENAKHKRNLRETEDQRLQLDRNVDHLRSERDLLQSASAKDRLNVQSTEKNLDNARQEITEMRLLNQDLQEEVQRLKAQLQDLKDRLRSITRVPQLPLTSIPSTPRIDLTEPPQRPSTDTSRSPQQSISPSGSLRKETFRKRQPVSGDSNKGDTDGNFNRRSCDCLEVFRRKDNFTSTTTPSGDKAGHYYPSKLDNVKFEYQQGVVKSSFVLDDGPDFRSHVANFTIVHKQSKSPESK